MVNIVNTPEVEESRVAIAQAQAKAKETRLAFASHHGQSLKEMARDGLNCNCKHTWEASRWCHLLEQGRQDAHLAFMEAQDRFREAVRNARS